ncbi:Zn-ribbon domain-containing OB-fold protein [Sphingomonas montanisoli]|uniref:DNA-binding protein n=1 Tax=Sphingomonas montanisoli TaxID=2606412 RepID=A0A5D9BZW5_9SPHN|nr:OB-fold domain-containing protein [Sphingomonas montanisoli]TZG24959.1 DNA-binding protein [Sphingomonas montanisoli]
MGIPVHAPKFESDLLKPFYEGLAEGELRLTADTETGEWVWYPPEMVSGRPHATLEWKKASAEGTVYTYTTVIRSLLPGDHKAEVPFTVVLVEPDDAPGCRVPGLFVADEGVAAVCDMRVRLHPVQAGDHVIAGFAPIS